MTLTQHEYIAILEELAEKYIKEKYINDSPNTSLSWKQFEQYLVENYGINGKNEILDNSKWLHYILSRS